jgi:hypothetical protein
VCVCVVVCGFVSVYVCVCLCFLLCGAVHAPFRSGHNAISGAAATKGHGPFIHEFTGHSMQNRYILERVLFFISSVCICDAPFSR